MCKDQLGLCITESMWGLAPSARKVAPPTWLRTLLSSPQPPSLDTSRAVDPFILDGITYYVRMGTHPVYFQIYMVKVSLPPGAPRVMGQPAGPQDPAAAMPWLLGDPGPDGCRQGP